MIAKIRIRTSLVKTQRQEGAYTVLEVRVPTPFEVIGWYDANRDDGTAIVAAKKLVVAPKGGLIVQ